MHLIKQNPFISLVIIIGFAIIASHLWISHESSEVERLVTIEILEQEKVIVTLAELTSNNSADAITAGILKDCNTRTEFEALLGNLARLNATELARVEELFDACGAFYAEKKALTVARFEREFKAYEAYVEILDAVAPMQSIKYNVAGWASLLEKEQQRSGLLSRQLVLQDEVITMLQAGENTGSDDMQSVLVEAQQVAEQLASLAKQINLERSTLTGV